jgi:hypothetical protein|tara:strand:- start:5452 stop:5808 length:357 start_codon:yes stop_codon:yes gene_type:complete
LTVPRPPPPPLFCLDELPSPVALPRFCAVRAPAPDPALPSARAIINERSRGVTADALDGPRNERCDVTNEEANPRDGTAADGGMLGLRRPATNRAGAARWLAIAWWSIALGVERRAVL